MVKIKRIGGEEILDSRGQPTLRAWVELDDGHRGMASVPSGASRGRYEARELRDGDPREWQGRGVGKALASIAKLAAILQQKPIDDPAALDKLMITADGTRDKSRLGANAILAISLAVARAAAAHYQLSLYRWINKIYFPKTKISRLPRPLLNFINGGRHARGSTDFQEFMIAPRPNLPFRQQLMMAAAIYEALATIMQRKRWPTTVGDEGGFAPPLANNEAALDLLVMAIEKAGYRPGRDVQLAVDAAASQLYQAGRYWLRREGRQLTAAKLLNLYRRWADRYPLLAIEDAFDEEAWSDFQKLTASVGAKLQIIGDDLYVTNCRRLEKGIKMAASNAVLVKPNQIGTLSETVAFIKMAQEVNWAITVSHRSGETCDSFIADLAVASQSLQIKAGALARSERLAKYNRLLEIARELKNY